MIVLVTHCLFKLGIKPAYQYSLFTTTFPIYYCLYISLYSHILLTTSLLVLDNNYYLYNSDLNKIMCNIIFVQQTTCNQSAVGAKIDPKVVNPSTIV